MVLFTKCNVDTDKPVLVVVLSPLRFIGGPTRQGRTGGIQGSWYPERSLSLITMVGVPVEYSLADIGMRTRKLVICMECDREAYCVKLIEEVWTTQRVDQWVYWFNKPSSREKVPNID